MASIAMMVSELAHSLGQPNNHVLRENLKLLIIQTRNECIRRSYENHGYVDKGLTQRFRVTLTEVNDGDITIPDEIKDYVAIDKIKRTTEKVPRPIRLTNNLPFDRVSSVGYANNREFPYIKETTARFRNSVPGLCGAISYDYINEYLYLYPPRRGTLELNQIVIESAFEHPNEISLGNGEITTDNLIYDDNEYLIPEDMYGQIKDIIYKRDLLNQHRETDETPNVIKF
ncbi:MAG: hypothetical protein PUJ60_02225 [bacterium]|nr:hypothetical protein [bacterium]MDY4108968.1 hypothetical protein [Bacilli bacterium]